MNIQNFNGEVYLLNNNGDGFVNRGTDEEMTDYGDVWKISIFDRHATVYIGIRDPLLLALQNSFNLLPLTTNLTKLYIENLGLTEFPDLPVTLEVLDIQENKLETLPKLPPNLTHLYGECNKLDTIEDEVFPVSLHTIMLGNNRLTKIPKLSCPHYKYIAFDSNDLSEIPELPISTNPNESITIDFSGNREITKFPKIPKGYKYSINIEGTKIAKMPLFDPKLVYFEYKNTPFADYLKKEYNPLKRYMKDLKRDTDAVNKIAEWYLDCKWNPKYKKCRDKLKREYDEVFSSSLNENNNTISDTVST